MRRTRLILVAGLVIGSLAVCVVSLVLKRRSVCPIEVRFLGDMESTNSRTGLTFTGPTFWISNRTTKTLHVSPWTVQIQDGVNWTKQNYRDLTGGILLVPCAVQIHTLDFSSQLYPLPTNTWRLEINVAEKLSKAEGMAQTVRRYPGWVLQKYRTGNTNRNLLLLNPLGGTWYGHPVKVVSENVFEHRSPGSSP